MTSLHPNTLRRLVSAIALPLLLAMTIFPVVAEQEARDSEGLQELLYKEILFLSRQGDYTAALTRWQVAVEKGQLPDAPAEIELLLARLKLAYGMDVDAALDVTRLMTSDLPPRDRNLAWYELARSFFHKGHSAAALEALDQVGGEVPPDIEGDLGLLRAHVLMALQRNDEAAQSLKQWRGPADLAPFAGYNRGIALVRAGRGEAAIKELEEVAGLQSQAEELLALRDRANLTLGYLYMGQQSYEQARACLQRVRLDSPYANRSLLALGWVAQQQGNRAEALGPWQELADRNATDPAVQESLLAVPALHRDLESLNDAAQRYEAAITVYSDELASVNEAIEALQQGQLPLSADEPGSSADVQEEGERAKAGGIGGRYYGPLLADRRFRQSLRSHDDLQLMLKSMDTGLQQVDRLEDRSGDGDSGIPPPGTGGRGPRTAKDGGAAARDRPVEGRGQTTRRALPPAPEWVVEWEGAGRDGDADGGIPLLPEINLSTDSEFDRLPFPDYSGLPESDFLGLPPVSEFHGLPPEPEDIGLPQSEIVWLPETGRFRLPARRGQEYAHPDPKPLTRAEAPEPEQYSRRITESAVSARQSAAGQPGAALQGLAAELAAAADRIAMLDSGGQAGNRGGDDLAARLAALRVRILALRKRIAAAIADYENYTRAIALAELRGRQQQLEGYLEQARLELAKTYDQAAGER